MEEEEDGGMCRVERKWCARIAARRVERVGRWAWGKMRVRSERVGSAVGSAGSLKGQVLDFRGASAKEEGEVWLERGPCDAEKLKLLRAGMRGVGRGALRCLGGSRSWRITGWVSSRGVGGLLLRDISSSVIIHVVSSLSLMSDLMEVGGGVGWRCIDGVVGMLGDRGASLRMVSEPQRLASA